MECQERFIKLSSSSNSSSSSPSSTTTSPSNSMPIISTTTNISEELKNWPVFRIKFDPKSNNNNHTHSRNNGNGRSVNNSTSTASISIRELSEEEIREEIIGGKKLESRVGFVLTRWIEGVKMRRENCNS